jgi:hypothetical protein
MPEYLSINGHDMNATHFVPKGNGWRPGGDYTALQARIIPDRSPVHHIDVYCHQLFG